MQFDSRQYAWADISLSIGGIEITGMQSVKYMTKVEVEEIYGKGNEPIGMAHGNNSYSGEFELLQSEYEKLLKNSNDKITGKLYNCVVSYGNPASGDAMISRRISGIAFEEHGIDTKQGDKLNKISLKFKCLKIETV
jgi:hypothetical protein